MSDTNNILKLANIKGAYHKTITVIGTLGNKSYYCLSVMLYKSYDKHSAFLSTGHATDNTNNHYGLSNNKTNYIKAISQAIHDIGLNNYTLTDNNLNEALIDIARKFNPNMTDFNIIIYN